MTENLMTGELGQQAAARLEDIVAAVLGLDPAAVADAAGPATLGGWTSRKHIELVVALEDAYGVSFSAREIFGIRCGGDLRETLRGKGVVH
jgi:acyl carrier protein